MCDTTIVKMMLLFCIFYSGIKLKRPLTVLILLLFCFFKRLHFLSFGVVNHMCLVKMNNNRLPCYVLVSVYT